MGVYFDAGLACIHVLFIRNGRVQGSRSYFPKVPAGTEPDEIVQTFIGQFYLRGSENRSLPDDILLDFPLPEKEIMEETLSQFAGRRILIQPKPRGDRARYLKLAHTNAVTALMTKRAQQSTIATRMKALSELTGIETINRMECFDISHTMGDQTVASCVVFDSNGPVKSEYRRYNITGITRG